MSNILKEKDIEKALEEIFGIPDDGSEDGFESDEAEEFNANSLQRILEDENSPTTSVLNFTAGINSEPVELNSNVSDSLSVLSDPGPSTSTHSVSSRRLDFLLDEPMTTGDTQQISHLSDVSSEESESDTDDESWGKNVWDFRPDPDVFDAVPIKPKYLLNRRARPVTHFGKFFNDEVFDLIVSQTNLYADQESIKNWKPVDKAEVRAFLGIIIIMGYHILPQIDLYWSSDPGFRVNEIANVMTVKRFKKILEALHLNNNRERPNRESPAFDKLYKIRPLLSLLSNAYQGNAYSSSSQSIDESMILFKGRSSLKQYMPLKPIKEDIRCGVAVIAALDIYMILRYTQEKLDREQKKGWVQR